VNDHGTQPYAPKWEQTPKWGQEEEKNKCLTNYETNLPIELSMNSLIFWDVTSSVLVEVNQKTQDHHNDDQPVNAV
jgi:hypothetical protein